MATLVGEERETAEREGLSLRDLWASARPYVLSYLNKVAHGDDLSAEAAVAPGGLRLRELMAPQRSATRCEFPLLRLVADAIEGGLEPSGAAPAVARSGQRGSAASLLETMWRRGVALYTASEAAYRWRVVRGACESGRGRLESGTHQAPRLSVPPGLEMRARLCSRYLEALASLAASRGPTAGDQFIALGVARSLVAEISLERHICEPTKWAPATGIGGCKQMHDGGGDTSGTSSQSKPCLWRDSPAFSTEDAPSEGEFGESDDSDLSEVEVDAPLAFPTVPRLRPAASPRSSPRSPRLPPLGKGHAGKASAAARQAVPKLQLSISALRGGRPKAAADSRQPQQPLQLSSDAQYVLPLSSGRDASRLNAAAPRSPAPPSARPARIVSARTDRPAPGPLPVKDASAVDESQSPRGLLMAQIAGKTAESAGGSARPSLAAGNLSASAYRAECGTRLLYASDDVRRSVLLLLLTLLVAPGQHQLDATSSDRAGETSAPTAACRALEAHLNHPANQAILPSLASAAARCGEAHTVLLRLLCGALYSHHRHSFGETIARGAFGTVRELERPCRPDGGKGAEAPLAVKLVPKAAKSCSSGHLPEVFAEVLALRRLQPSGVAARLVDYGCDASTFFLVMPRYMQSLRAWRREACGGTGEPPTGQLFALYAQALSAVAQMHDEHIEHFDIKADNCLLEEVGEVGRDAANAPDVARAGGLRLVIADLGVARIYGAEEQGRSPRDRGTECVKSPEMLEVIGLHRGSARASAKGSAWGGAADAAASSPRGASRITRGRPGDRAWAVPGACDVWACGCLLYEVLTGDYLFEEADWFRFYLRVTSEDQPTLLPPHLSRIPASHADQVAAFLGFVLERDPHRRPCIGAVRARFGQLARA